MCRRASAALILAVSLALPGVALALVPCFDFSEAPRWLGFARTEIAAVDVLVDGDLAYLATRTGGIEIMDVSDPAHPTRVGGLGGPVDQQWTAVANALALRGDHLYVADGPHRLLHVVDVADPTAPVAVGQVPTGELPRGIDLAGDRLYAAVQDIGVEIYDLADPLVPVPVDTIPVYLPLDVTVANGLLYVPNGGASLPIYDVSVPDHPVYLRSVSVPHEGETWHVAVRGGYAYVAGPASLWELDVSDPAAIGVVRTIPQWAFSVAVDDRCVYLATDGLEIWDLAEPAPTAPVSYLPQLNTGGLDLLEHAVVAHGLAFVAAGSAGLAVADVSPQLPPTAYDNLSESLPRLPHQVRYWQGDLLVADGTEGLLVYDLHDPSPGRIGQFTSTDARDMAAVGDLVYLADGPGGLVVVDLGDRTLPVEIGRHDPLGNVVGLELVGDRAYLADARDGLLIVDVSDPTTPVLLGEIDTADDAEDVAVAGDHAFVAIGADGVQVVDVSDPATPHIVATVDVIGRHESLARFGTTLYVGGVGEDLVALDISDPAAPAETGRLPLGADDLLAVGRMVMVAAGDTSPGQDGVTIVDATDPAALAIVGFLPTWENCTAVAYDHGSIVGAGLRVRTIDTPCFFDNTDVPPQAMNRLRVTGSPNPFNPRLEIAYELDRPQTVTLEVVDLAGRRLAVLAAGAHASGPHTAHWDGRDRRGRTVASGTYFLLLRGEEGMASRKVTLVR